MKKALIIGIGIAMLIIFLTAGLTAIASLLTMADTFVNIVGVILSPIFFIAMYYFGKKLYNFYKK